MWVTANTVIWPNGSQISFDGADDTLNDRATRIRAWNRAFSLDEVDPVQSVTIVTIPRLFGTLQDLVSALATMECM